NSSKDFALKWVTGTEGPRQVSAKISSTIAGNINSTMESDSGAEAEANVTAAANLLNNAAFAGLTKDADWWQQVRNTTTDAQEFRAYALYIIDTKTLDRQVAAYIQRFLDDKNRALSEAEQSIYKGLIESLLSSTIDLNT
ncbi:MAG: hypothetical protein LBS64_03195, partial [Spirochaetaceae bacterium]|nr:hypothetical protein [Spirochaetaceae bacterium]